MSAVKTLSNLKSEAATAQSNYSGFEQRSNYKLVWNRQAQDIDQAKLAVAGFTDETILEATAEDTIRTLRETVGIHSSDIILEIGCGVGRVGNKLAELCHHWIGTDISGEMIRHTRERLKHLPNVSLIELHTVGLDEVMDGVLDLVYCTVVFMHLLEWDRYRYVSEAFRVLGPGGRCYFDNVPLHTDYGWKVFQESAAYPLELRPAHVSMTSTRDELRVYLERAGFDQIEIIDLPNGHIAGTGVKPVRPKPSMAASNSALSSNSYDAHLANLKQTSADEQTALRAAIGGEFIAVGKLERDLLRSLGLKPTGTVVDVGCGSGRLAYPLSTYMTTGQYYGLDVVEDFVRNAEKLSGRADWIFNLVNGIQIPFPAGIADFVTFFSVLTHLTHEDCYRYLAEARRVLADDGKIVFSFLEFAIPCHWDVFEFNLKNPNDSRHHNQFVGRDAIHAWAQRLDLEVVNIFDGDKPHIPLTEAIKWDDGRVMEKEGNLGQSVAVLRKKSVRAPAPTGS